MLCKWNGWFDRAAKSQILLVKSIWLVANPEIIALSSFIYVVDILVDLFDFANSMSNCYGEQMKVFHFCGKSDIFHLVIYVAVPRFAINFAVSCETIKQIEKVADC